jgi:hypothetical protein
VLRPSLLQDGGLVRRQCAGETARVLPRGFVHLPRVVFHADVFLVRVQVLGLLCLDQAQYARQLAYPLGRGCESAAFVDDCPCSLFCFSNTADTFPSRGRHRQSCAPLLSRTSPCDLFKWPVLPLYSLSLCRHALSCPQGCNRVDAGPPS